MTRQQQITQYVDACEERDTLRAQLARFPELKQRPGWERQYDWAVARAGTLYRVLRGGDLGIAHRMLRERAAAKAKATVEDAYEGVDR
jgi:hypothetical protein